MHQYQCMPNKKNYIFLNIAMNLLPLVKLYPWYTHMIAIQRLIYTITAIKSWGSVHETRKKQFYFDEDKDADTGTYFLHLVVILHKPGSSLSSNKTDGQIKTNNTLNEFSLLWTAQLWWRSARYFLQITRPAVIFMTLLKQHTAIGVLLFRSWL